MLGKFKAVNTRDKIFTRAKMKRRMAQIEESVRRYRLIDMLARIAGDKITKLPYPRGDVVASADDDIGAKRCDEFVIGLGRIGNDG